MSDQSVRYVEVSSKEQDQRLDNFLMRLLKGVPRGRVYKMIRGGEVRVSGKRAKPDTRLQEGDRVRIPPVFSAADSTREKHVNTSLADFLRSQILQETNEWLLINKPAGIAVHGGNSVDFSLLDAIHTMSPDWEDAELVHRLDRDTSGCLLIAKRKSVLRRLQDLWRSHQVHKEYVVLVRGVFKDHEKKVSVPLLKTERGRDPVRVDEARGKASTTVFYLEKPYKNVTLLRAVIETGRTHQIRVHAAHLGFPVAGDMRYGDEVFNRSMQRFGLGRLFLHAHRLRFEDGGVVTDVTAPLEAGLADVLKKM